jgi:hypothetical protein
VPGSYGVCVEMMTVLLKREPNIGNYIAANALGVAEGTILSSCFRDHPNPWLQTMTDTYPLAQYAVLRYAA